MKKSQKVISGLSVAVFAVATIGGAAHAALVDESKFTQVISAGTLSTSILDASQNEVAAPNVPFTPLNVSTSVQTSTGTYGTDAERIYVDNPGAANGGWTLSLAATDGTSSQWSSGANTYPYNAATPAAGQLTINPSAGALNVQAPSTTTGVSLGSSATFVNGSVDSIELVNAGPTSDDIWRGYVTGVAASQQVPASTPAGNYEIDFTQTVAAQ